jgi:hypothetical protein
MESPKQAHFAQHDFRQLSGLRKKYLDSSSTRIVRQPRISHVERNLDTVINCYVSRPKIEWNPSYSTYQSRVEMLSKLQFSRLQSVPPGFPKLVEAPWVWDGSDYRNEQDYVFQLEEKDIEEIETAVKHFKSRSSDLVLPRDIIKSCLKA